ncbi:MAG: hypothetical protein PHC61_09355 [Chitinivibrionales bacterium]|nr:hypothetical protein [Chitinivibrionales bacterium]
MRLSLTLCIIFCIGALSVRSANADAASYWAANLPVNTNSLAAPYIQPFYTCAANYYVAKTGSDATGDGSSAKPWLTIGKAVAVLTAKGTPQGGVCVTVGDGIYNESILLSGLNGSSDTSTGYFVLRSSNLHGATIQIPAGANPNTTYYGIYLWNESYVVVDGFTIIGFNNLTGASCSGIMTNSDKVSAPARSHHIHVVNNVCHDCGGSGTSAVHTDYWRVEGNVVYNCANTSQYGESGVNQWHAVAFDSGSWHTVAGVIAQYHYIIRNNISFNNAEVNDTRSPHTDGNGIIIDDFVGSQTWDTGILPYQQKTLVENNLSFGNGGAGIVLGGGGSSHVTIRNNTCFDNYLDTLNTGTWRGEISLLVDCRDVIIANNIAVANPIANTNNVAFVEGRLTSGAPANVWVNNLSFDGTQGQASIYLNSTASTITATNGNILGADPLFVNPKTGNFSLQAASPAISHGTTAYGAPAFDLAGNAQTSPPCIGAYAATPQTSVITPGLTTAFDGKSFYCTETAGMIHYSLPKPCFVSIKYYDLQGRIVSSFVNKYQAAGNYAFKLPVASLARNVYIQEFKAGDFVAKELGAVIK